MHLATGKRCTDAGSGDALLLYDASSIVLHACDYGPPEEEFFDELLIRTADRSRAGEMKGVRDHQTTCEAHSGDVAKWEVAGCHMASCTGSVSCQARPPRPPGIADPKHHPRKFPCHLRTTETRRKGQSLYQACWTLNWG